MVILSISKSEPQQKFHFFNIILSLSSSLQDLSAKIALAIQSTMVVLVLITVLQEQLRPIKTHALTVDQVENGMELLALSHALLANFLTLPQIFVNAHPL